MITTIPESLKHLRKMVKSIEEIILEAYNEQKIDSETLQNISNSASEVYNRVGFVKEVYDYLSTTDIVALIAESQIKAAEGAFAELDDHYSQAIYGCCCRRYSFLKHTWRKQSLTAFQSALCGINNNCSWLNVEESLQTYLADASVSSATVQELTDKFEAAKEISGILALRLDGLENVNTGNIVDVINGSITIQV